MFVDNKSTRPQDNSAMIHQYRMDNDPRYAGQVEFDRETSNQALEPSMLDPMMMFVGPTRGGFHELGGAVASGSGRMMNPAAVQGRREALKTGGIVAGGAALGAQPAVQAVKMFGDDAIKPYAGQSISHLMKRDSSLNNMYTNRLAHIGENSGDDVARQMMLETDEPLRRIENLLSDNAVRLDSAVNSKIPTVSPAELKRFISENKGVYTKRKAVENAQAQLDNLAVNGKIYRPSEEASIQQASEILKKRKHADTGKMINEEDSIARLLERRPDSANSPFFKQRQERLEKALETEKMFPELNIRGGI